jgi:hypothetical protein
METCDLPRKANGEEKRMSTAYLYAQEYKTFMVSAHMLWPVPPVTTPLVVSGLRLGHFAGIILGVGATTLLDLIIFRFVVAKRIEQHAANIIMFSSYIIFTGLVLLWLSGLGFSAYYWYYDPVKIGNPKLLAKVTIVGVLTLNALLVHYFVLPQIAAQVGRYLFDGLSRFHCFLLVSIGTISAISWYVPLVLGAVPQFDNISATSILTGYAALVILVNVMAQIVLIPQPRRTA